MLEEFRKFLMRGNVIDLAVAVVIGAAFTAIVNSLINDIIMPAIGLLIGGVDFTGLSLTTGDAVIAYGNFLQAVVNFLLIGLVLFLIVRSVNRFQTKKEEAPPGPSVEERLLTEIRDLLREHRER
ncbi:MAG TPA: large-conductance mechanosensitive channel protein MscL [Anaerolineales bacterium]|nr:large-conductance mechanosensitive channel protein MscL [Anaerolineales bacterium]